MTLEANLLRPDCLRSSSSGYELDLHLTWYRSLPLSCVENVAVSINGNTIDVSDIKVKVGDDLLTLEQLQPLVDEWWFIQDAVTFVLATSDASARGMNVDLSVELALTIPYIIIGPDMALVQRTSDSKEVTVQ